MYENLSKYRCGHCGNNTFEIYQQGENKQKLISVCTRCKSATEIVVTTPELQLNWGESGEGIMSIFNSKE